MNPSRKNREYNATQQCAHDHDRHVGIERVVGGLMEFNIGRYRETRLCATKPYPVAISPAGANAEKKTATSFNTCSYLDCLYFCRACRLHLAARPRRGPAVTARQRAASPVALRCSSRDNRTLELAERLEVYGPT
jgi:hypothetical protein